MAILSTRGVKPEMVFHCCDCGDTITGQQVLNGDYLHIVKVDKENPINSTFRCECCQDDYHEKHCTCDED